MRMARPGGDALHPPFAFSTPREQTQALGNLDSDRNIQNSLHNTYTSDLTLIYDKEISSLECLPLPASGERETQAPCPSNHPYAIALLLAAVHAAEHEFLSRF